MSTTQLEKPELSVESRPTAPPQAVVKDAGEFLHDIVTLAELQAQLVKEDAQRGLGRVSRVGAMFLAAAIVGVSVVPVALLAIAYWITTSGLSLALSMTIATGIGLLLAAILGFVGWKMLKSMDSIFERSKKQFAQNLQTLKYAMKRNA